MSILTRMGHSLLAIARALDIVVCALWLGALYPLGLADRPWGRETISGYVGRAQFNGHRWGHRAATVIDWLALKVGDGPDHCYRAYIFWRRLDPLEG